MLEDLLFWARFRARRRAAAVFQPVCMPARWRWGYDPRFEPYSDGIEWVGRPSAPRFQGEVWLVGERLWHGWPDPPEFVFWALAAGDAPNGPNRRTAQETKDARAALRCAADFDAWPAAWTRLESAGCAAPRGGGDHG